MAADELEGRLIEELKRDPKRAFYGLVERYEARIWSFAARMCRSTEDAKDVVQETFLAAFRAIRDFRGEAKLGTWLFRIAANACLKQRRRGKYEPERELSLDEFMPAGPGGSKPEIPDWSQSPQAAFHNQELREVLEEGIARLPEPYRVVLALRDVEGFSAEETGEILALSVAAVKTRLHRARLFLRQWLSRHLEAR